MTFFRQGQGRWSLGLIVVALLAAWPLLHEPGLLNTRGGGDSPFLLQRLQQLTTALAEGHFPVRWMPDANYGYGYPFYNYYAPLSLYIAALFRFLGFSFTRALQLTQLLGFLVAAFAVFALVKRWWQDEWAAFIAATAYSVAPFHLVNVYVRGDSLAEFWAMAFYPLILLAVERLARAPQMRYQAIVGLAFAYAALILSHNVSALIFSPFLLLYASLRWWQSERRRQFGLSFGAGFLLALLLSAWFWLPALGETSLAQTEPITAGYFHYSAHFRGRDLVQDSVLFDFDVAGGKAFRVGLIQFLGGLLGLVGFGLVWRRKGRAWGWAPAGFTLLVASIATFMITPLSTFLWETLPLLSFTQFPWRFLSVLALGVAGLTAGVVYLPGRQYVAPLTIVILLTGNLLGLETTHLQVSDTDVSGEALAQYEWFTGNIGTTVSAEYLPVNVTPRPQTSSWLNSGNRDELTALEGVVSGQLVSRSATRQEWQVAVVSGPAAVIFPTLYWPGWEAEVNGEDALIGPAPGSGLIAVPLNSDKHTIVLRLRRTPIRLIAELLSLASLLFFAAWTWPAWRPRGRPTMRFWRGVAVGVGILMLMRIVAAVDNGITQAETTTRTWDFAQMGYLSGADQGIFFADGSRLLNYTYEQTLLRPGELFAVAVDWELPAGNVGQVTLDLVNPAHTRPTITRQVTPPVMATDTQRLSMLGSNFVLVIPGDIPPGLYVPRLTLTRSGVNVAALTDVGEARGALYLAPIRIDPFPDLSPPEAYAEEPIPPPFRLLVNEVVLRPDNALVLKLAWLTTAARSHDYNVSLRLTDDVGNFLAQLDTAPGFGFLPSSRWPANEWIDDWLVLPLPAELPTAEALTLTARLYRVDDGGVVFTRRLGALQNGNEFVINTPVFELPDVENEVAIQFGEFITLRGYAVDQRDDALLVTLYWQADGPILEDYTHFVHVAPPGEPQPVAQHDTMPQNNNYPTSQWSEGEVVVDQLVIPLDDVAAGSYEIRVGLYRPDGDSFPRLTAVELPETVLAGAQFILEPSVIVTE